MALAVVAVVIAYLVGTFPTAVMVGNRIGRDPTAEGSGNPGASNIYRIGGRRAGVIVGLIDVAKGTLPTLAALMGSGRPLAHAVWAAAVAGHVWPVTRRLRGGKGVATAGGGGLVLSPPIGLLCGALFLVVVRVGRIPALGSLSIALGYPLLVLVWGRPVWEVGASAGVAAILVIRHQTNIRRILTRQESRVGR